MKFDARSKFSTDDLGFERNRWNRETEDRLNTFYRELSDAVDEESLEVG